MTQIERDARIFIRDHFTCQYCGFRGGAFEKSRYLVVDHFKPRRCLETAFQFDSRSYNADDNLKTCCVDCNLMKSDHEYTTFEEAVARITEWIKGERRVYETSFVSAGGA